MGLREEGKSIKCMAVCKKMEETHGGGEVERFTGLFNQPPSVLKNTIRFSPALFVLVLSVNLVFPFMNILIYIYRFSPEDRI